PHPGVTGRAPGRRSRLSRLAEFQEQGRTKGDALGRGNTATYAPDSLVGIGSLAESDRWASGSAGREGGAERPAPPPPCAGERGAGGCSQAQNPEGVMARRSWGPAALALLLGAAPAQAQQAHEIRIKEAGTGAYLGVVRRAD